MTSRTVAQAFADAAAALTREYDVTGLLSRLVRDCAELVGADTVGILVLTSPDQLELLASTSHRIAELDIFELLHEVGPGIDAIRASDGIEVTGAEQIRSRWPTVGSAIVGAGYVGVKAYPLRWRGDILGALSLFYLEPVRTEPEIVALGQAFADIATVVILQHADVSVREIAGNVQLALAARTSIEQAKGVLAYQHDVDMATAYDLLVELGGRGTLTDAAADVIAQAQSPDGMV